jgi:two-component system response regulator FixJ
MTTRRVYVIDDEEPIRRSLDLMLRVMKYEARAFASGTEFLENLPTIEFGCVLLDMRMPDVDGLEVQRRLLSAAAPHSVVMMSGHGDLSLALTAMEQGAIAFIEKPFPRALLERVLQTGFLRLEDSDAYVAHLRAASRAVAELAPEDRQVLDLMVRGHDLEGISAQTGTAQANVELAQSRIFARLEAPSLVDVLRIAFEARRAAML